jgi:Uri superfamily endonuclease
VPAVAGAGQGIHSVEPKPGTYALILRSPSSADIQIGRWGRLNIAPGYYIYVGSALGPGGVRARVSRHFRKTKSRHWHIDYLRDQVAPVCAWYSYESINLEHRWAQVFSDMPDTTSVEGFGCSDCRCYAHLFASAVMPDIGAFSRAVGGGVKSWLYRTAG